MWSGYYGKRHRDVQLGRAMAFTAKVVVVNTSDGDGDNGTSDR